MQCIVLGAGVSGLTTAVCLLRAGWRVRVVAERHSPHTTSDVPAAFFFPYGTARDPATLGWVRASHRVFARLARDDATGVRARPATAMGDPSDVGWWLPPTDRRPAPSGARAAIAFTSFVIDMRRYMPWLRRTVAAFGGKFETRRVARLADLDAPVVVCCAGLGARTLAGDPSVHPVRGQILRVTDPGLSEVVVEESDPTAPTYVVPRGDDCIVGGTFEPGRTDLSPDPEARAAVLARARRLVPRLCGAHFLEDRVGLRPGRPAVRVAVTRQPATGRTIAFDYGHGGAGVTLSWGCALALRRQLARGRPTATGQMRVPP